MATGVAVPTKRDAHAQASAPTTHRELGWFYHMQTFGAVKAWPWGSSAFSGGAASSISCGNDSYSSGDFADAWRERIVRELKALVRTGTLPPLVADLVVKHAEGVAGTTLAPPKPSASGRPRQKSKASKPAQQKPKASEPQQQKPKASKGVGILSRLRRFGRSKKP